MLVESTAASESLLHVAQSVAGEIERKHGKHNRESGE